MAAIPTSAGEQARPAAPRFWPLGLALGAAWAAMLLSGGNELDRWLIVNAHVSERPWVLFVLFLTRLGDWEVLLAFPFLAVGWLLLRRRKRLALFLLGSVILGRLLVSLQKILLGRARPEEHEHLIVVETFAFPSGHAANAMIVYLLLALLLIDDPRRRLTAAAAAAFLALLIGASRVLLGVHWPTDVVGGWAFGLLWVLLSLSLRPRLGLQEAVHTRLNA